MKNKYSLKQRIARTASIGGLAAIALTAPGCSTLGNFAKDQLKPYIFYSKDGILNEKTGEREHSFPYYKTDPFKTYATLGAHVLTAGAITYGIKQYYDSQQTPTPEPELVDEDGHGGDF